MFTIFIIFALLGALAAWAWKPLPLKPAFLHGLSLGVISLFLAAVASVIVVSSFYPDKGTLEAFRVFVFAAAIAIAIVLVFLVKVVEAIFLQRAETDETPAQISQRFVTFCAICTLPASGLALFLLRYKYPTEAVLTRVYDAVFQPDVGQALISLVFGVFCVFWFNTAQAHAKRINDRYQLDYDARRTLIYTGNPEKGLANNGGAEAARTGFFDNHGHHLGYGAIASALLVAGLFGPTIVTLVQNVSSVSTSFLEASFSNVKTQVKTFEREERLGIDFSAAELKNLHTSYTREVKYFQFTKEKTTDPDSLGRTCNLETTEYDPLSSTNMSCSFAAALHNFAAAAFCIEQRRSAGVSDEAVRAVIANPVLELTFELNKYWKNFPPHPGTAGNGDRVSHIIELTSAFLRKINAGLYCSKSNSQETSNGDSFKLLTEDHELGKFFTAYAHILILRTAGHFKLAQKEIETYLKPTKEHDKAIFADFADRPHLYRYYADLLDINQESFGKIDLQVRAMVTKLQDRIQAINDKCPFPLTDKRPKYCPDRKFLESYKWQDIFYRAIEADYIASGLAVGRDEALALSANAEAIVEKLIKDRSAEAMPYKLWELSIKDSIAYTQLMVEARRPQPNRKKLDAARRAIKSLIDQVGHTPGAATLLPTLEKRLNQADILLQ